LIFNMSFGMPLPQNAVLESVTAACSVKPTGLLKKCEWFFVLTVGW
jgi:hypothetical protein